MKELFDLMSELNIYYVSKLIVYFMSKLEFDIWVIKWLIIWVNIYIVVVMLSIGKIWDMSNFYYDWYMCSYYVWNMSNY